MIYFLDKRESRILYIKKNKNLIKDLHPENSQ